ncbi:MAG: alkaline phosphatase family protein [Clostridia bacterium]|nr:alkaline phosphatase family protein [Clostridia bacterium]
MSEISLTRLCATLCSCLDIEAPQYADKPIDEMTAAMTEGGKIERIVMYNPDAVGRWIVDRFPEKFDRVRAIAPYVQPLKTVFPPKTPVCFATMYTGALPEKHGIQRYTKPIVQLDSIFDALIRQGKNVAIVAVKNSSLDKIFRGREGVDYYSEQYDKEAASRGIELIKQDKYDFILIYNQAYDDSIHFTHPLSRRAKRALDSYADNFEAIAKAISGMGKRTLLGYAPDHGVHREWYLLGNHGKDIPKDMLINHFYTVID